MNDHDPVDEDEFVFRRIHPKFFAPAVAIKILYDAFRPNQSDTKGLSVLRARFARPEDCLLNIDRGVVHTYAVARLAVRDILRLGLTVVPDPVIGGPPGHATIPQLNWDAYTADKHLWRPIIFELAKFGSGDIVQQPQ